MAYARGGIGDGRMKKFLYEVIDSELAPIRERRKEMERSADVMEILRKGTLVANAVAEQTLHEVKQAMGIDYFVEK